MKEVEGLVAATNSLQMSPLFGDGFGWDVFNSSVQCTRPLLVCRHYT